VAKSEAQRYLQAVETELVRGTWVDPALGKVGFGEYTLRWRQSVAHLRPSTLANLDSRLRKHVLPAFGEWPIGDIEPVDIRAFVAALVNRGLSPATVKATYHVVSRICATATIDGVIPRSPCVGVHLPRDVHHQEMHFLTASQVRVLAESIEKRYRVLIYTAAYTGMRWGELAGLQTDRCNFLRGSVDVAQALSEVNGRMDVGPTKTGRARTISLPRFLIELLAAHLAEYGSPGGYVFTSAEGAPLRRNFYRRHYRPAVARTSLPQGLRFHDLRHTCVALLVAQGAHPKEIQERLGHSTIKLTFDRYGHIFPTLDDRLRNGLEQTWQDAQGRDTESATK
jgi:integrase